MKPFIAFLLSMVMLVSVVTLLAPIAFVSAEPYLSVWRVSATRNDGNSCQTSAVPCATINGAIRTTAAGLLDPGFGTNGVAITSLDGSSGAGSAARQVDGKIVLAGGVAVGPELYFALVRYTVSGTLDTAFGVQGIVTTAMGTNARAAASAIAIQPDGKLVAAGSSSEGMYNSFLVLARYTTTGVLDPEFGVDGIVTTPVGMTGGASAVALQPDGKIVVAGSGQMGAYMIVARYTITGSLDTGFGTTGMVTLSPGNFTSASSVVIQPDHKIIVAGVSGGQITIVRLDPSGLLDTTFDSDGIAQTSVPGSSYAGASGVALQADGKIVVAGSANDILAARYNVTGTLDSAFGSGGIVTTSIGLAGDFGSSIAVQPDGRIVVGGVSNDGVRNNFALVRYSSSGILDPQWGVGGVVTSSVGMSFSTGSSVVLQPDGKIVLAGSSSDDGVKTDFAVARYLGDVLPFHVYLPLILR